MKRCTCNVEDGLHDWNCAIEIERRDKEALRHALAEVYSNYRVNGASNGAWFKLAFVCARAIVSLAESAAQLARVGKLDTAAAERCHCKETK